MNYTAAAKDDSDDLAGVGKVLAEHFLVASSTLRVCRVEFRVLANSLVALTHTPIAVHPHLQDRRTVQRVCAIVAKRAARLAAMAIAAVVAQMDSDVSRPTAAVDGSVFAKYPRFKEVTQATKAMLLHFFVALTGVCACVQRFVSRALVQWMQEALAELGCNARPALTQDGSGIGAALIAVAARNAAKAAHK